MTGMGQAIVQRPPPFFVEIQDSFRIAYKCSLAGIIFPVIFVPNATLAAIGGYSRLCGHTCSREKYNMFIICWIN
jgi:hypothetical protein